MKNWIGKVLDALSGKGAEGERPEEAVPLPSFEATNHAGQPRGPDDIKGRPAVLWFYPKASTPG